MEKAEKDLKRAQLLFDNADFEGCCFHSHQAAEKALKALYILKFKRLWKIHDLEKLALTLNAKKEMVEISKQLNPHYVELDILWKSNIQKKLLKVLLKMLKGW